VRTAIAWLLALACAAWAAMRLLGLERGFPLVPLVAYTPFVVIACVVVVVVSAVLLRRGAAVLAAVAALALVAVVAPRAMGGPTEPEGDAGPRLRVLTANMHFGTGSAEALVSLVRSTRPDVLSVQEMTPGLVRRLDAAGLGELMPEFVIEPQADARGTGLYARFPLTAAARPAGTLSVMATARARVSGGPEVELVAIHPPPPLRRLVGRWDDDLRALPGADPDGVVRILAGDFNATLDHAELRRLIGTGYEDAAATVGAGLRWTWPRGRRLPPPVTIDHVLADERCGVRAVTVHSIPGTDHRAVLAELVLPRSG
jgi:endonuclease/exonuclease/phosphatase (EEP) superfamily protein YafD